MDPILQALQDTAGVHFMGVQAMLQKDGVANNLRIAQDAQPQLVTVSNAGIPAFLSTFIDPKMIEVLIAPMKAAMIAGPNSEVKKGDWVTDTAIFPVVESTGETSSYGDYSENGVAGTNVNFPQRQSYHYQVITEWGERELERAALAKIDLANRKKLASILTLNKFQNKSYFFGVDNLQNYGLLNDPALPAPIQPGTKAAGGTSWSGATAIEVVKDIRVMFAQLQSQAMGLVDLDTRMVLAMSPNAQVALTLTNDFNVNVVDILKKNFPNLRFEVAPEYSTASGELVQLIVEEIDGQRTVEVAFTEKLRSHPIVVAVSSFKQKNSQGTWGAIIYRPFLIAQMLGV